MYRCTLTEGDVSAEFNLPYDPSVYLEGSFVTWTVGPDARYEYTLTCGDWSNTWRGYAPFVDLLNHLKGGVLEVLPAWLWSEITEDFAVAKFGEKIGVRMSGCSQCYVYTLIDRDDLITVLGE